MNFYKDEYNDEEEKQVSEKIVRKEIKGICADVNVAIKIMKDGGVIHTADAAYYWR